MSDKLILSEEVKGLADAAHDLHKRNFRRGDKGLLAPNEVAAKLDYIHPRIKKMEQENERLRELYENAMNIDGYLDQIESWIHIIRGHLEHWRKAREALKACPERSRREGE